MLKLRKIFFFFNLKTVFCNYKYLFFMKNKCSLTTNDIHCAFIKSNDLFYLFNKSKKIRFLKFNYYLYCFNNYATLLNNKDILLNNIYCFSYYGYFLNNIYVKNLHNYYFYYFNNYKIYTYWINKPTQLVTGLINVYYFKLLKLLITLKKNYKISL